MVVAAAAPVWVSVEAAERIGPFTDVAYPAYEDWVGDLVAQNISLIGALDTVALSGEPVEVLGQAGPDFLQVRLPEQPDGEVGYAGFIATTQVGEDARTSLTHRLAVDAVFDDRGKRAAPAGVVVEVIEIREDGVTALLASGDRLTCARESLRPLDAVLPPEAVLEIAFGYLGSPYVWGGVDRAGIDCSGLVHIAARIAGRCLPRDAHHQWAATRADVAWESLQRADILYFGERAALDGIDHVGFYAGEGRMLHAPEEGRSVVLEPISEKARARLVGVGRLPVDPPSWKF